LGALGGCGSNAVSHESSEESAEAFVFPSGPPPKKVVVRDLKLGHGPSLKPGDYISVNYVAYSYATREPLETHWGPAETFGGTWGRDRGFIQAWEIGLRGMKEGGLRELIVPGKFVHGGPARVYRMKMVEIIRVSDIWEDSAGDPPPGSHAPPNWAPLEKVAGKGAGKLVIPHGPFPKKIVTKDLRVGGGPTLELGDKFSANYIALRYPTSEIREDRWEAEGAGVFELGEEAMVDGWIPGLKGMRFGGKRELMLPGRWAYGIPLIYVVELLKPATPPARR
jgi:peptidylprolyl isomerase